MKIKNCWYGQVIKQMIVHYHSLVLTETHSNADFYPPLSEVLGTQFYTLIIYLFDKDECKGSVIVSLFIFVLQKKKNGYLGHFPKWFSREVLMKKE